MNEIAFQVVLKNDYDTSLEIVTNALKAEGFGVLTKIDVKATLKEKIGADFRQYTILGACNPPLAHKALETEPLVGLMLPCNVTVEATEEGTLVNLVNPKAMLLTNPLLAEKQEVINVANDAYERFQRVHQALSS
jgi:uncharacterized protein (DUF302 family)